MTAPPDADFSTAPDATREVALHLVDAAATARLGALIGQSAPRSALVFLEGNLGAGKTTLTRGLLHALGHVGTVRSPTYTLVETYSLSAVQSAVQRVAHFDLYRLCSAEELEDLGFRDYLEDALVLIEWPEKGTGVLPVPNLRVQFQISHAAREVTLQGDPDWIARIRSLWAQLS